ncbi:Carrier protein, mitochondrial [Asimina triloba]
MEIGHCFQKDPSRAMRMTTRQTLIEVWRDGGMKGLFTGIGPRLARAGPSVGIVVELPGVDKTENLHQA